MVQGTSWIVVQYVFNSAGNSRLLSLRLPFIPYSDANLATVDTMAARDSLLLKPLAVAILLFSLAAIVLYVTLYSNRDREIGSRLRASLRLGVILSAAAAMLSYAAYEKLMSSFYDIRIDLLIFWPLLGFALIAALGASLLGPRTRR